MSKDQPISRTSPSQGSGSPEVTGLYEPDTGSIQYVVACPKTGQCAIVDPVLNFDPAHARCSTESAEELLRIVRQKGYDLRWILDTHPHADHLTASHWLREQTGVPAAIGAKTVEIAHLWEEYYNLPGEFDPGRDYDRLLEPGDSFRIGELDVRVMLSPGHTLGSITYVVGEDAAFVHDTFMHPDAGTARADFPGGSADELYTSLKALLDLPDRTRLFVGHDYGTKERDEPLWEATVAEQKAQNIHLAGGTSRADYVALREGRDKTLDLPDRMLFALQINLRGGRMPPPEADGRSYAKIPLNRF